MFKKLLLAGALALATVSTSYAFTYDHQNLNQVQAYDSYMKHRDEVVAKLRVAEDVLKNCPAVYKQYLVKSNDLQSFFYKLPSWVNADDHTVAFVMPKLKKSVKTCDDAANAVKKIAPDVKQAKFMFDSMNSEGVDAETEE